MRVTILVLVALCVVGCGTPLQQQNLATDTQYVRKAASGMRDTDGDGIPEEFVIGVFTIAQVREYVDSNKNGELDAGEVVKSSAISMVFDHNTNWRGFIEFTTAGTGWTFNGELDLEIPSGGIINFGKISEAQASINSGTTVTTTRIINYPDG